MVSTGKRETKREKFATENQRGRCSGNNTRVYSDLIVRFIFFVSLYSHANTLPLKFIGAIGPHILFSLFASLYWTRECVCV